jgi:hypothetical protein
MIDLITTVLAAAAVSPAQPSEPMQVCEIQTQAWCLVQSGTLFDVTTTDYNKRVWTLRDKMFGSASITIVEDRACSSYPSDIQHKSEGPQAPALGGNQKYVIIWKLHKDDSCNLSIEIPMIKGVKNIIAYEVVIRDLKACPDVRCTGPSVAGTPVMRTTRIDKDNKSPNSD